MSTVAFAFYLTALYFREPAPVTFLSLVLALVLVIEKRKRALAETVLAACCFLLLTQYILITAGETYGFAKEDITAVYGTVDQDSLPGKWDSRRTVLRVQECFISSGEASSARGLINVTYPDGARLYSGDKAVFYGKFSEYGFNARYFTLTERARVSESRRRFQNLIEERILGSGSREDSLSLMLLLGYCDHADFELSKLAQASGTSYVLALSGMHLSLLTLLLRFCLTPFLGKRGARLISLMLTAFYVYLIGPKASILRAFILSCVFFLTPLKGVEALFFSFMIQAALFPCTLVSLASCYSYLSLAGIMFLSSRLRACLDNIVLLPVSFASQLAASISALLFTCPLSYLVFGSYQLSVILTGGPVSFLIYVYMLLSIFSFFPSLKVLVYQAAEAVMRFGSGFGQCSTVVPYFILLALMLLIIPVSAKLRKARNRQCGNSTTAAVRK